MVPYHTGLLKPIAFQILQRTEDQAKWGELFSFIVVNKRLERFMISWAYATTWGAKTEGDWMGFDIDLIQDRLSLGGGGFKVMHSDRSGRSEKARGGHGASTDYTKSPPTSFSPSHHQLVFQKVSIMSEKG